MTGKEKTKESIGPHPLDKLYQDIVVRRDAAMLTRRAWWSRRDRVRVAYVQKGREYAFTEVLFMLEELFHEEPEEVESSTSGYSASSSCNPESEATKKALSHKITWPEENRK